MHPQLPRGGQGSGQSTPRQVVHHNTGLEGGGGGAGAPAMEIEVPPIPGTVDQVHWLLQTYRLKPAAHIATLKQCSSSLFVLICSRLMNSPLTGIQLQPDTYQKKMTNIRVVLSAMESIRGKRLEYISAHEIVMLNETHVGYLVALFVEVALHIQEIQQQKNDGHDGAQTPTPEDFGPSHGAGAEHNSSGNALQEQQHYTPHESTIAESAEDQEYEITDSNSEPTELRIGRWKQDLVQPPPEAKQSGQRIVEMRKEMQNVHETFNRFQQLYGKPGGQEIQIQQQPHPSVTAARKAQRESEQEQLRQQQDQQGKQQAAGGPHVPQHRPTSRVTYVKGVPMGKKHHTGFDIMSTLPSPLKSVLTMGTGTGAAMPGSGSGTTTAPQQQQPRMHRDERIAMLKNKNLLDKAQKEIESGLRSQHSLAEAAMAEFGRGVQKQRRRDLADLKKFAKDDDAVQRAAYMQVIAARKNNMVTKAWLAKDELYFDPPTSTVLARRSHTDASLIGTEGHMSDARPTDTVLAAKRALAEYAVINQADMVAEYQSYRGQLSDWQNVVRV